MNKIKFSVGLVVSSLLVACGTTGGQNQGNKVSTPAQVFVQKEIVDAANAVDKSVKLLIEIETSKQAKNTNPQDSSVGAEANKQSNVSDGSSNVVSNAVADAKITNVKSVKNTDVNIIGDLDKKIKINWKSEPLELLIENVAKLSGFGFAVGTPNPGKEVRVTVDIKNVTARDVLKRLGEKLGDKADIVVNNKEGKIILNYK